MLNIDALKRFSLAGLNFYEHYTNSLLIIKGLYQAQV